MCLGFRVRRELGHNQVVAAIFAPACATGEGSAGPKRSLARRAVEGDAGFRRRDFRRRRQVDRFDARPQPEFGQEGQLGRADGDLICVAKQVAGDDPLAVDARAGPAAGVANVKAVTLPINPGMHARDGGIVDDQLVHRPSSDKHAARKKRAALDAMKFY
jgi:hypothetical protein